MEADAEAIALLKAGHALVRLHQASDKIQTARLRKLCLLTCSIALTAFCAGGLLVLLFDDNAWGVWDALFGGCAVGNWIYFCYATRPLDASIAKFQAAYDTQVEQTGAHMRDLPGAPVVDVTP